MKTITQILPAIFIASVIVLISLVSYKFVYKRKNNLKTYKYKLSIRHHEYQYTDTFYITDRFIIFNNHEQEKKMVPFEAVFNITENY